MLQQRSPKLETCMAVKFVGGSYHLSVDSTGPYLGRGYGINPLEMLKNFICLYSKVVYEDAHKQALRGEIAATRYVSEPQKCVQRSPRPPSW